MTLSRSLSKSNSNKSTVACGHGRFCARRGLRDRLFGALTDIKATRYLLSHTTALDPDNVI